MATNHAHEGGEERNPSVGYDKSDLGARGILIFFLVLALFAIGLNLISVGMYVGMTRIADKHDPETSPLAPKAIAPRSGVMTNTADINLQKFPEPRLQNDDTGDMTRFLQKETTALTAEPWQDAEGNVHLPIAEAMQVVAARLPVRAGTTALPNYPGTARHYSYPTAADEIAGKQEEVAAKPESEAQETHGETETPVSTK
jgi:hypothetical protein